MADKRVRLGLRLGYESAYTASSRERLLLPLSRIQAHGSLLPGFSELHGVIHNTEDIIPRIQSEHRPGLAAAAEMGIVHPFLEACMGKDDIAELGALLGARYCPSDSCLATRIPHGEMITTELLTLIESMEAPLRPSVKGRFRVTAGTGRLHIYYSAIDEKQVKSSLGQMRRIAERSGQEIELHLLEP